MAVLSTLMPHTRFLRQILCVPSKTVIATSFQRSVHKQKHDESCEVEEVRIHVPYGEIAGKWWGPRDVRPIVALHGWQENAGSFDRLIPMLPKHMSFLALDFPGHGSSSWIPDGMTYHILDSVTLIKRIMKEYQWKKISFMSHSMGSLASYTFSTLFPNKVDLNVSIDILKPHISYPAKLAPRLEKRLLQLLVADTRNRERSEPPSYTYEELVERLYEGTLGSVSKEAAPYLLNRNIKKSTTHADKYIFTRDNRVKYCIGVGWGQDMNLELAKRLTMPSLFFRALKNPYNQNRTSFDQFVKVIAQNNPHFELEFIDSNHHMHLSEPEKIAPSITKFLHKHWKREEEL